MGVQTNLKDIQSGFLSAVTHTANNTLIEEAFDRALDRTGTTNNAMQVNFDMGGHSIINLGQSGGTATNGVNRKELEDLISDTFGPINAYDLYEEKVTLSSGDLVVVFSVINVYEAAIYLIGKNVDQGRLLVDVDYTIQDENTIVLNESYPDGTVVTGVINDRIPNSSTLGVIDADQVAFDNTNTTIVSTHVQGALEELNVASGIVFDSAGSNLTSSTVQAAILEVTAANKISYNNAGTGLAAGDVQTALTEINAIFPSKLDVSDTTVVKTSGSQSIGGSKTFTSSVAVTGNVSATGNLLAYQTSDREAKEDFVEYEEPTALVSDMFTGSYRYLGEEDKSYGLIAQDVQKVFPEIVDRDKTTGHLKIKVGGHELVSLALGAIKELTKRVEVLEAKV